MTIGESASAGSAVDSLAGMVLNARRALGLTQREMADRMAVSRSQVANVEAARTDLRASAVVPLLVEAGLIFEVPDKAVRQAQAVEDALTAVHRALDALAEAAAGLQRVRRPS